MEHSHTHGRTAVEARLRYARTHTKPLPSVRVGSGSVHARSVRQQCKTIFNDGLKALRASGHPDIFRQRRRTHRAARCPGTRNNHGAALYSSPILLKPGLYDYSIEAGLPRRNQGTSSFDYQVSPAGSASLRYGFEDWLTVEGHAEGMETVQRGRRSGDQRRSPGCCHRFCCGSVHNGTAGVQLQGGWEFNRGSFYLSASARRGFGAYADVGIASADQQSTFR